MFFLQLRNMFYFSVKLYNNNPEKNILSSEPTDGCSAWSSIVVWCVVVGWDNNITIGSIREGITISFVKVTSSCSVGSRVISKVWDIGWRSGSCCPAWLQGCSSRVGGREVDWITIQSITNQLVCSCSNTWSWELQYKCKYIQKIIDPHKFNYSINNFLKI